MKKFSLVDLTAIIVWLLPIGYLLWVFSALPPIVPLHYGISGKPDRYGSKNEFLVFQLGFGVVALFVYLLLRFISVIDPKKQVSSGAQTFQKLALGLVLFLSALSLAITFSTLNQSFKIDKLLFPVIGLFFAFLGNVMYNIKPNYFAGIRTPWTLEDEDNWRATHHLAGKLWFAGGIIITVVMLFVHGKAGLTLFLSAVAVLVLVPTIYSYLYFKKHKGKS